MRRLIVTLSLLALTGQAQPPSAPSAVEVMLKQNSYDITLSNGKLAGRGADLLLNLGSKAQFVAIGEEHNNADIPPFVSALFRELHARAGYNFLIDEQDPIALRMASEPPLRGNLAAIRRQATAAKHSFTFNSDEELEMLAEVGRISTTRSRPLWGCEQAFGATHILERAIASAPSADAKALAASMLGEARKREAVRDNQARDRYLADPAGATDAARLAELYASSTDPDVRFAVDALGTSFAIYQDYLRGAKGEVPGFYANRAVREEHMKAICRGEYLRAAKLDGKPPRAIMKFGHWHLYQTNAPSGVPTLGAFMADVARLNGLGFVSVAVMASSNNGKPLWSSGDNKAFAGFAPALGNRSGWTLIDLRPFRELPAYKGLLASAGADLPPTSAASLERLVYGFDFVMFLPEGRSAHYQHGQRSDIPASAP